MRKDEVPQDAGLLGPWKKLHYAVDEKDRYVTIPSAGSEPMNVANQLAWELVERRIEMARQEVLAGKASPLAYHMHRRQMDESLLAQYSGLPRRKVLKHLTAEGFREIEEKELEAYADALDLEPEELKSLS
jgi:myo-inositol-1-phosphate synthase